MSWDERVQILDAHKSMPVSQNIKEIVYTINGHIITIILSPTGSGKTTGIPAEMMQMYDKIVVTQPRVIAAMSNAARVSQVLLADTWNPNYSLWVNVGYRTWKWSSSRYASKLSFNTDGLEVMRQSISGQFPDLLFVDEVHGFSIPTEILLHMIRTQKNMKIVLMSATLDPKIFQHYFKDVSRNIPVIQLEGRTYPIEKQLDGQNYEEFIQSQFDQWKNILLFREWKKEIEEEIRKFKKLLHSEQVYWLHAETDLALQKYLVSGNKTGKPRLIIATEVARESITIPDVNVVVTLWKHKRVTTNVFWIWELHRENASQAEILQEIWRCWRTLPGVALRENDVPFEKLPEYPTPPIERVMIDRYILIMLAQGFDIRQENKKAKLKGERLFIHEIPADLLDISYERLFQIGAIDQRDEITDLWMHLLNFPLDVYNARILQESIERRCSAKTMIMAAILEKKWFVSKDPLKWQKIKLSNKNDSDLFWLVDLYELCTARKLPISKIQQLTSLWVDKEQLEHFVAAWEQVMLFECVDLGCIGIKNKKVGEVYYLVQELEERMRRIGVYPTDEGSIDNIKVSLLAWNMFNIFEYDEKTKKFINTEHKRTKDVLEFKAGDVSQMKLENGKMYIGIPFIIGSEDEEKADFNLLTYLTSIDDGHISDLEVSIRENKREYIPISWSIEDSERVYWNFMEGYGKKKFADAVGAQEYYTRYWLVDYLIGYNQWVKKYLKWKSADEVSLFRELLSKHIQNHLPDIAYRFDPKNVLLAQKKFKDDTVIMDSFFESKDTIVVAWIEWKWVHELQKRLIVATSKATKSRDLSWIASPEATRKEINHEVLALRERYARLVKGYDGVKQQKPRKRARLTFIDDITESLKAYSSDYNSLIALEENLKKAPDTEIHWLLRDIKIAYKRKNNLDKQVSLQRYYYRAIETCFHMFDMRKLWLKKPEKDKFQSIVTQTRDEIKQHKVELRKKDDEKPVSFETVFKSRWLTLDHKFRLRNFLKNIGSDNEQKRRRHARSFFDFIVKPLTADFLKVSAEVKRLRDIYELRHIPIGFEIKSHLEQMFQELYEPEYYKTMIAPKIPKLVQDLVRDSVVQRRQWFDAILLDFISTLSVAHNKEHKKSYETYIEYVEKLEHLEVYATVIKESLSETEDVEFIRLKIAEVERIKEEIDILRVELEKKGYLKSAL
jgi:HrpA-like RNA helicase